MTDRNPFLEQDGIYYESDTHEWFNDKSGTNYAQTDNGLNKDALKNICCFVIRNKKSGEYDRVIMDLKKQELIYDTKSLEDMLFFIDRMKIKKRFKK
jgi:hypothetical protein